MFKSVVTIPAFACVLLGLAFVTSSCDWTSGGGGESFNTSQGAGVDVNWSGVYFGQLNGLVVQNTSGEGAINRLVITQAGNRLEVIDNQGSKYVGSVGVPNLLRNPETGLVPAGATFVEAQVSFSGKDEVAGQDIDFVGVIHIVTVEDVQGESVETVRTETDSSGSGESSGTSLTTSQQVVNVSGGGTVVEPGNSSSETNSVSSSDTTTRTTTSTTTFQITEANSQFRLQGTWIEQGGLSSNVDALSPGGIATITTSSSTTTQ